MLRENTTEKSPCILTDHRKPLNILNHDVFSANMLKITLRIVRRLFLTGYKFMKITKMKILFVVVLAATLVAGIVFAYFSHEAYVYLRDERTARQNAEIIYSIFEIPMQNITDTSEEHIEEADLTPFRHLIATARELIGNGDIVAYISIPNTNVSYAVVQADNNSFYLNHDIHHSPNTAGSIFLHYLNSPNFTDINTVIFGHNMRNGTKFHNLRFYVFGDGRVEFFEEHSNILVVTDYDVLVYEIFSVFTTGIYFDYIQVEFNYSEFAGLVDELNRRSYFDMGVIATAEDNLLILSTCTGNHRDTRIVVVSRLIQRLQIPQT